MLQLTRLGGPVFALNPDLIERAEATPDTVVTLVNGSKYVIRESLDELAALILAYRADIIVATQHRNARPYPRQDTDAHDNVVALRPGES
jgi:flagellar protein FlbD